MSRPAPESLEFPYVRFPVVDPLTKRQSTVYRPVIPVRLRSATATLRCQGLIDSGADEWNRLRFGLLGQVGFLSHVTVTLDHQAKTIHLAPHPSETMH